MFNLSSDQKKVLNELLVWYKTCPNGFITLGGYAGTGKTTLVAFLRRSLHQDKPKLRVAFVSFTGRAARVLKQKIYQQKVLFDQDFVGTIHSLIYSPIIDKKGEIVGLERRSEIKFDLIIIDEASMVDEDIWQDLLSYQIPIIAVGDHGQLPPIRGHFNLMKRPDLRLENIHRQAQDNPIIKVATIARRHGAIPALEFSSQVLKIKKTGPDAPEKVADWLANYQTDTLILCGYNNTRIRLNNQIRKNLGFELPVPQSGDRVICLKNNHEAGIYNGMLGTIDFIEKKNKDWYFAEITMDEEKDLYGGLIALEQFNNQETLNFTDQRSRLIKRDLFDFGYALTVHKAQGTQSKKVILFEERFSRSSDDDWRRWLYTAVTRAEDELYIVG
ncbi:MAG: ATP-dependent RecD-like DNA helicase [Candidatus Shapirobacteria bacterium]|nr:ATP-dependent RecD-like DNA helicase [Candidatus Shapirobacteria bacterium]